MTPLSGMKLTSGNRWFQQQAKSALLSCLALFAVCDRRACNGFFDADPTWFYNPLLSSFRRSRPNRCDVRAMRERSPATGPQRRPSPRHTKLQDLQGTQRRGRGSQSFWRTSVLFADAVSNNKKASIFHENTIFKSYVYLS